ncbi:MAG: ABC transporter permease [Chloroflexota bacterium]
MSMTTPDQLTTGSETRRQRVAIVNFLFRFQSFFGLFAIFVLAVVFSPIRNNANIFLRPNNLINVLLFASETGILAIGMTLVILVGGIDLSVGSIMALIGVASADLILNTRTIPLPILGDLFVGRLPVIIVYPLMLLMGLFIGWVNGWVSERFKIPSFITTLAMLSIARGLAHVWSQDNAYQLAYGPDLADPLYKALASPIGSTGIPAPVVIMLVCGFIVGWLLNNTLFGRHIYAVGGNPTAARLSGINVSRLRVILFMLCGMFAALAAMIHTARLNQGSPNESQGYELNAIAAVVIGGTSLAGGKGTIVGSISGAIILQILDNILGLNNVDSNVQLVVKGILVLTVVALQQLRPDETES